MIRGHRSPIFYFENVFTDEGTELGPLRIEASSNRSANIAMPDGIPVKCNFIITDITSRFGELSYVEISIRGIKVSIRNLPVKWE